MTAGLQKWFRIGGFLSVPILSAASPLIALPALTTVGGAPAWAAVAVGQSLGAAGATLVELGWSLTGPQRVARRSQNSRSRTLALSLLTKIYLFPLVALTAGLLGYLIAPEFKELAALTAFATVAGGLSLSWYFIGLGKPSLLLLTDTIPRLLFVTASAGLLLAHWPFVVYPIVGILIPSLLAPALGLSISHTLRSHFVGFGRRRVFTAIAYQRVAMSGRLTSSLYIALPVTIVSLVAPAAVPSFGAVERLQRMYLGVLSAFPNSLQGWVGKRSTFAARLYYAEKAVLLNFALGLSAGAAFYLLAPLASSVVFSGTATVSAPLAGASAALILIVCISRSTGGHLLVGTNQIRTIAVSAVVGASVGIPAIALLAYRFSSIGALSGEILAETCVLLIQLAGWRRVKKIGRAH